MNKLISLVTLIFLLASSQAFADASAQWKAPVNDIQPMARSLLERSNVVSDFLQLINSNFKDSERLRIDDVTVVLNNRGAPSANLETRELSIPYEYVVQAITAQSKLEDSREAALKRGIDTIEYTLYHLWAHVVTNEMSPDSDDNAEAISSWLMIKGWPNGGEQWFEDSQAFGRASQLLDGSLQDYWHAHSLYKTRNQTINCWILGSNPDQNERLLKSVLDPAERRSRCVAQWQELDRAMGSLLAPLLKAEGTLAQ